MTGSTTFTAPATAPSAQLGTAEPILFVQATIIDGSEDAVPYTADVLVADGLIARIGPDMLAALTSANASANPDRSFPTPELATIRQVDAQGWVLCPGFIDMHAHSDLYLLTHPTHEPKISQGCTLEVIGQDGIAYAPVRSRAQLKAIREQIAGWNGNPTDEECAAGGRLAGIGMFEWETVGEYLDCLERNRTATNVCMLVPQGNLRLLACGPTDRVASAEEIEEQVVLLREAMDDGAVGMSSGLTYTPGMYASTSELAILCRTLSSHYPGAFYAPHHRSYGHRAIESYAEMLHLATSTGCPVHLTHATLNFAENAGRAPGLIRMIDECRAGVSSGSGSGSGSGTGKGGSGDSGSSGGADISLDTYPYLPGCTTLAALLPSWASSGGPQETLKRLQDEETRERIRVAVEVKGCDGGHGIPTDWESIQVGSTSHPSLAAYSGRRIAEIARSLSMRPIDLFFDILTKDRLATSCLMHIGNEENVQAIMQHETHCGGSDAILHGEGVHPRAWGTFPRFLAHYSRDLGLLPLPSMIAHLTSRPARRLSLFPQRGLIAEGSAADLVLFHPEQIRDTATFERPKQRAEGVRFVLVNGVVAVDEGEVTGVRGGRVLRRRGGGVVS